MGLRWLRRSRAGCCCKKDVARRRVDRLCLAASITGLLLGCIPSVAQSPLASVNPFIGTDGDGNTFPGATLPFGMIQWSPDTDQGWYRYRDLHLHGFSLTHLSGAGCPVLGDMPILPWSEPPQADRTGAAVESVGYAHASEVATPGYYSVRLEDGTSVELAVTLRAGIARIRYPHGKRAGLLVNGAGSANSDVHVATLPPVGREHDGESLTAAPDGVLLGTVTAGGFCGSPTRYTLHVAYSTRTAATSVRLWQDGRLVPGAKEVRGRRAAAWLDLGSGREQLVKVGLSWVSEEKARQNLEAELPGWDFDTVHRAARKTWTEALEAVSIGGGTREERTIFYTGLYHMLLAPNLFSDADGEYTGFDGKVHQLHEGQAAQYANFSDWDTYRNVMPLQALLSPQRAGDMAQSLVNDAEQMGSLPRWALANDSTYVMGGDSPAILLAEAYSFGARGFDAQRALHWMRQGALTPGVGIHGDHEREHLADYLKLGYSPAPRDARINDISASETLEFANADFAVAQFAKALGDADTARTLLEHSRHWRNLFDPQTRWIRPRYADGSWLTGFDAERSQPKRANSPVATDQSGFEEGNTYQYTFMLPYDYAGLFRAMGDDVEVERRLDHFFAKLVCWGEPCFNMANEPDFVTPFAYTALGKPWKTAAVLTRIENETFQATPGGLPGNDDLGATSGVYVWNVLGMYPGIPGLGGIMLGAPRYGRASLPAGGGKTLVVERTGEGPAVQSVQLNGKPWPSSWLPLSELQEGENRLEFTMGAAPGRWATDANDRLPSQSSSAAKQ